MPNRSTSSRVANYQSDSIIPFDVIRILNNHDYKDTHNVLNDWPMRPPLMALISGPFVHVFHKVVIYRSWQEDEGKWGFITDDGYWIFRIVGTALNALVVFVPFLIGALLSFSPDIQIRAASFIGLGVFTLVNIYFTWPKFLACFFMALSLSLVQKSKENFAGFTYGLSYLSHPLSALFLPGYLLFCFFQNFNPLNYLRNKKMYGFVTCFGITITPWLLYDIFINSNSIFLKYPLFNKEGTSWLWFRIQNTFNTIFPYGFSYNPNSFLWDRGLQAIPASEATSLWFTWTNYTTTLAGALGLVFCWTAYYGMIKRFKEFERAIYCLFIIPFLTVLIYWGFTCHGFFKEAGQPLLFVPLLLGISLLQSHKQRAVIATTWLLEFLFFLFIVNFKVKWKTVSLLSFFIILICYSLLARYFLYAKNTIPTHSNY